LLPLHTTLGYGSRSEMLRKLREKQIKRNLEEILALQRGLGKSETDSFDCQCCGKKNLQRIFAVNGHLVGSECRHHPQNFPCRSKREAS